MQGYRPGCQDDQMLQRFQSDARLPARLPGVDYLRLAATRFGLILLLVLGLAGCGSSPTPTVAVPSPTHIVQTPTPAPTIDMLPAVSTAEAWLRAMGDGDDALENAYLIPSRRFAVGSGGSPHPNYYQNIHCSSPAAVTNSGGAWPTDPPTGVVVRCGYDVPDDPIDYPGGGWSLSVVLVPQPDGSWLVYDWGN